MGPHGSRVKVMGKEKAAASESEMGQLFHELLKVDIYKRSQGRIVRQMTCLAIWVAFALAAYQLFAYMLGVWPDVHLAVKYVVPVLVLVVVPFAGYAAIVFFEELDKSIAGVRVLTFFLVRRRFFVRLLAERNAIRNEIVALGKETPIASE